ncbi:hypothetical protein KOI35_00855 [Actinoplanes bogorensis]|uniref:Uncharacterized protein n=1 Tax=Paractinoplanes bogorensis TaxID=1610840 RepID=A0ABS5YFG3_9ACTN|nr:hypothetical protein [Actinoplanes bogorensis]MBU2662047.1 hypothetical protein [Actinoplanes bogorensis]
MTDPRRHSAFCPRGRPPTGRRLEMFPDYGAFPVWGWFTLPARGGHPARDVHGGLGPRNLGISDELAVALKEWAQWQNDHQRGPDLHSLENAPPTTPEDWADWDRRGRELASELARETGDLVVYLWPADGRDASCPHCGEKK